MGIPERERRIIEAVQPTGAPDDCPVEQAVRELDEPVFRNEVQGEWVPTEEPDPVSDIRRALRYLREVWKVRNR